jgi:predicted dehydrogenase
MSVDPVLVTSGHDKRMTTIRWGIIGCGDVTEVKSGPALARARHSALVAVMRRDAGRARDYARRHAVAKWYDDADALVRDPDVDAVYVATPPHVHRDYVLLAASVGKAVYVEKPMALSSAECRQMIEACRVAGVRLFTAYYRRALPRFLQVRSLVASGAIGTVRSVNITLHKPMPPDPASLGWRVIPQFAGGGLFVDLASHTLDLLDYVLGPIRVASSVAVNQAGRYGAEDHVCALFEFPGGVRGVGDWCFSGESNVDRCEIAGTDGVVTFATFADEPVWLSTPRGGERFTIPHPPHIQQPLIQTIVDDLNGEGACPSTGVSGARTTQVMETVLRDYYASPAD